MEFIGNLISRHFFNISILTKIEFLGWDKHTQDGFQKCNRLLESAKIYHVDEDIANKAIELRRKTSIKLADAVIAATAILNNLNNLRLATRNVNDFKGVEKLEVINPFKE
jgi:hypothetical protein